MAGGKVYECTHAGCGKVYISFQGFKEHRKEHGGKKFVCKEPGCGRHFQWRSSLMSHKKAHASQKARLAAKMRTICAVEAPIVRVGDCDINDELRCEGLFLFPCESVGSHPTFSWEDGGLFDSIQAW